MAYKDEYEVARLYADGRFAKELGQTFTGGKAEGAGWPPPMLSPKDANGKPRKMAFGGWMMRYGFPVLARLKGLRGGPLDLFGASEERRMERALISPNTRQDLEHLAGELTPARLPLAVEIASSPGEIRGFGHVKAASAEAAKAVRAKLWAQWDTRPA